MRWMSFWKRSRRRSLPKLELTAAIKKRGTQEVVDRAMVSVLMGYLTSAGAGFDRRDPHQGVQEVSSIVYAVLICRLRISVS